MNNRQEKPPLKCLLGIDPEKTQKCKPSECASCGWEAAEAARRREYVKEHGLTLCADGFRRLIIKKENDMATPYKECPHCGAHLDSGEKCDYAVDHGWWEGERTFPEIVALIHSEVSEALEEYRDGKPLLYFPCNAGGVCCEEDGSAHCGSRPYDPENPNARCSAQSKKPEGIAAELADVIIRVLDYCAYAGIDIENVLEVKHEYNKSRPYRHGGKKC